MPLLRLRWLYLSTSFSFLLSGHLSSYPLFFSGNSRSRFRGLGCETPPPARFSVKIPELCEDDFCRNRLRHDLAGWNKGVALPLPTNRDDWLSSSFTAESLFLGKSQRYIELIVKGYGGIEGVAFLAFESLDQLGCSR